MSCGSSVQRSWAASLDLVGRLMGSETELVGWEGGNMMMDRAKMNEWVDKDRTPSRSMFLLVY